MIEDWYAPHSETFDFVGGERQGRHEEMK